MTMAEKVGLIKLELSLPQATSMAGAVKQANDKMGIIGDGPLPSQVDKLLAAMGLPRASRPLPAPPAARPATSRSYAAASVSLSSSQR